MIRKDNLLILRKSMINRNWVDHDTESEFNECFRFHSLFLDPFYLFTFYKRENWSIFKAINRETTHKPLNAVEDDVLKLLRERRIYVVHRELLPEDYDPDDIVLEKDIIDRLIPYYF